VDLDDRRPDASGPTAAGLTQTGIRVGCRWTGRRSADQPNLHWEVARLLLDAVTPDPARDEWVHNWYLAAAGAMRSTRLYSAAGGLLGRARQLFRRTSSSRSTPAVCHEAMASPGVQAVVMPTNAPESVQQLLVVAQLASATSDFKAALDGRADWAEARMRYGA